MNDTLKNSFIFLITSVESLVYIVSELETNFFTINFVIISLGVLIVSLATFLQEIEEYAENK